MVTFKIKRVFAETFWNPTPITLMFSLCFWSWVIWLAVSSCCRRLSVATVCPAVWRSEDGAAGAAGDVWQQSEGEGRAGGGAAALQGRAGETVRGLSGERPPPTSKHSRKGAWLSHSDSNLETISRRASMRWRLKHNQEKFSVGAVWFLRSWLV